ncbi:MAG TPA: hypothetical protein VHB97_03345 [Polyangia bacterium]|nr:hypothetical protein [Polyangia bacterium]
MLEDINGKLQLLVEGHMALLARFDGVDARFDGVDARLDRLEGAMRAGFADHEVRITKLEKRRR